MKKSDPALTYGGFASEILSFATGKAHQIGIDEPDLLLTLCFSYCLCGIAMDGNAGTDFNEIGNRLKLAIDSIIRSLKNEKA